MPLNERYRLPTTVGRQIEKDALIFDIVNAVLRYQSGEEIQKGDNVLFHRSPASVELVAFDPTEPEHAWYVQEFGGGVMISDPRAGRTFVARDELPDCEDLEFVSRSKSGQ